MCLFHTNIYKEMEDLFNQALDLKSNMDSSDKVVDPQKSRELTRGIRESGFSIAENIKHHLKVGNAYKALKNGLKAVG